MPLLIPGGKVTFWVLGAIKTGQPTTPSSKPFFPSFRKNWGRRAFGGPHPTRQTKIYDAKGSHSNPIEIKGLRKPSQYLWSGWQPNSPPQSPTHPPTTLDFVSLGFLFIIVLASGGIAVLADELGRKIGKSRRTIGKLRPKHTAKVFTFVVGVLVSMVTIGVLFTLSADVRAWIIEGRAAIAKLKTVQASLDQTEAAQIKLKGANHVLQSQNLSLENDNQRKVAESKVRAAAIKALEAKATVLRDQISQFRTRVEKLRTGLETTRTELRSKQALVAATEVKRKRVQVDFNTLNRDYRELSAQNIKLDQSNQDFERRTAELQKSTDRLVADKSLLEQSVSDARANLKTIGDRLDGVVADLAAKQYDLNQAELQLQQLNQMLNASLGSSRYQPLIFAVGEEVARLSVPADLTVVQAQTAVNTLVRQSRTLALDKGAKDRGDRPAAGIFERIDPATKQAIPMDAVIQKVIQSISGKSQPQVLVTTSSINAFKGEPVSLEMSTFSNPMVYRAGDVLAEAQINGRRNEEIIFEDVTKLILGKVKDRAQRDHLLPKLGTDPSFGVVPPADLLGLVVKIRAADRIVRVQAYVDTATQAADPLRLKFRVK